MSPLAQSIKQININIHEPRWFHMLPHQETVYSDQELPSQYTMPCVSACVGVYSNIPVLNQEKGLENIPGCFWCP